MNLSTAKWAQWNKTQSRELLGLFMCVCIALCTIVAHIIAQNRHDNFPPYPLDSHHCSDDVYLREGDTRCLQVIFWHLWSPDKCCISFMSVEVMIVCTWYKFQHCEFRENALYLCCVGNVDGIRLHELLSACQCPRVSRESWTSSRRRASNVAWRWCAKSCRTSPTTFSSPKSCTWDRSMTSWKPTSTQREGS